MWDKMGVMTNPQNTPERVAYSLKEFAALFHKNRSWAYRQVTQGRIRTITGYGVTMVPASEIDRILSGGTGPDERPVSTTGNEAR